MTTEGIGAPLRRKEDRRFLVGKGRYTDDINRRGQVYAYFVRSPHAHARIKGYNTAAAEAAPGVVRVLTGKDWADSGLGGLITGWAINDRDDNSPMKPGAHPCLATEKVRYVGDHVAVVIAETVEQAKDAAELVEVDYEILPAVISLTDAAQPGSPLVFDDVPNNTSFRFGLGDKAATEAAFAGAARIVSLDIVNNRLIPNAMEPRAAIGEYDDGSGDYTLYTTSQNPHVSRLQLSAFTGLAPEHKIRVVAPDVGGGFGSKIYMYAEETVCLWASKLVDRPIKWVAERTESFLSDAHGRDHVTKVELALDADHRFVGLRIKTLANVGAYLSLFGTVTPTYLYATLLSGQYKIPAIWGEVDGVFTTTAPVDAYRGAGRPEATYLVEHVVEMAARQLGVDPAELRRKNFVPKDECPYQTPVLMNYDSFDFHRCLDEALELADYKGFAARKAESATRGKLRGVGFSSYIEACGLAPSKAVGSLGCGVALWEAAHIRFNPTGNLTVHTGAHSHGQGHETAFAQLAAEYFGVPADHVEVVHGDTGTTPFGMGTYGSRSIAVGGSAIHKAAQKIIAKGKKIAAHLMEAAEGDIEFADGKFTVAGTDKAKTIQEIAFAAYVPHNYPDDLEPGLEESGFYDPLNFTFPSGTMICEVEVDPETGKVDVVSFTAVDDFGTIINPLIVDGQVHGGVAQGIGQALTEQAVYDSKTGQLLTGSYMDYCLPRASDVPSFTLGNAPNHNPSNPLGVKGCGEAGAIGAPAAVMNAVTDAIGTDMQMPATPLRVWTALQGAKAAAE